MGQGRDTRLCFYSLKEKLEKKMWDRIADLFKFYGFSDFGDGNLPDSARGRWVTHDPKKVMERLDWE